MNRFSQFAEPSNPASFGPAAQYGGRGQYEQNKGQSPTVFTDLGEKR
jgi:hypothetical protein